MRPTRLPSFLVALSLILGFTALPLFASPEGAVEKAQIELFEVLRVVDGDTIHIRRDGEYEKLRLLSVDTEERVFPNSQPSRTKPQTVFGEECAVWAARFFKGLARDDDKTYVSLGFPGGVEERDPYGRLLCHVILEDGRDFNLMLVELGKSPYFNKYGNSRICHEAFVSAQREARKAELGIWNPATNEPKEAGAPAAKRPYDELMPWWEARAIAIDDFRKRSAERPGAVISSEDPEGLEEALKAKKEVEVFGSIDRLFEESNGDLTVMLRATDRDKALRVTVARKHREAHAEVIDFEATKNIFRQNYVYVRGKIEEGRRGLSMTSVDPRQWRLAGPEPEAVGAVEAGSRKDG